MTDDPAAHGEMMESAVRLLGREAIVLVVIAGLCGLSLTPSAATGGYGFQTES